MSRRRSRVELAAPALASQALATLLLGSLASCASPLGPGSTSTSLDPPSQRLLVTGRRSSRLPFYRESELAPFPFVFDTHLGIRQLKDNEAWSPLDDQAEVGLSLQVPVILDDPSVAEDRRVGLLGALSYDFGIRYAFDRSTTTVAGVTDQRLEASNIDLMAGILLSPYQLDARIRPYLGGGLAFVFTDTDLQRGDTIRSDRDSVVTGYLRGGVLVGLDSARHVGLDVRWLADNDAVIDGINADVGAVSVSLVFGSRF